MTVNGYLFAAYVVIWTVIFAYMVFLHRRQRQIGEELKRLSQSLKE